MDAAAKAAPPPAHLAARRAYSPQETAPSVAILRQGMSLLDRLDDGLYAATHAMAPGGGIGRHIRHCIDVYDCFLRGVATGLVDYTERGRDPLLEIDRLAARRSLEAIVAKIIRPPSRRWEGPLRVRPEEAAPGEWVPSSVARELEFVRSHAVHHYAFIGLLLRASGFEPGEGFGVAPSTLRAAGSRVVGMALSS